MVLLIQLAKTRSVSRNIRDQIYFNREVDFKIAIVYFSKHLPGKFLFYRL